MQGPPEAPGWGGRAPWHPGRKRGHSKEAKRVGIWGTSARPSLVRPKGFLEETVSVLGRAGWGWGGEEQPGWRCCGGQPCLCRST